MLNLITLATLACASAFSNLTLTTESSDSSLSGKGISNIHFGAGINGALISNNTDTQYQFNLTSGTVYQDVVIGSGPLPYVLGEYSNELIAQAGNADIPVVVDCDGYLSVNCSSSVFYACDKISWDPYHYIGPEQNGVAIYGSDESVPSGCTPIKIKASTVN